MPGNFVDLFCGRGGWSKAAARAGFTPVGFDIVDHDYPWQLCMESLPCSVGTLLDLRPVAVFASPPCDDFARACLPWLRLPVDLAPAIALLQWSIGLARALPCPVIVECSHSAARYVPGARFAGSFALWGDVPALLPNPARTKQRHGESRGRSARRAEIPADLADWLIHATTTGRSAKSSYCACL